MIIGLLEFASYAANLPTYIPRLFEPMPLIFGGLGVLLVVVRRRFPHWCLGLVFALQIGSTWLSYLLPFWPFGLKFVILVLMFNLGRWGSGRAIAGGTALTLFSALGLALLLTFKDHTSPLPYEESLDPWRDISALVETFSYTTMVNLLALALGHIGRYFTDLRKRDIDHARHTERMNMARELHDSVAHHVSAIAVQAAAGEFVAETQPNEAIGRLSEIKHESAAALADMHRIVSYLRDEDENVTTTETSGIDRLMSLVQFDSSTPPLILTTSGDTATMPDVVANSLFRIVQESITNARRHSTGASHVEIDLRVDDDLAAIRVINDGDITTPPTTRGFGISGIFERTNLLGGTASATPHPDGGWVVEARIPFDAPTP